MLIPNEIVDRLVRSMCPEKVCQTCGLPSQRVVSRLNATRHQLAVHIQQRRLALGLSQNAVAEWFPSRTGGLTGCVSNWENGKNVPTVEQWQILRVRLTLSDEFDDLVEAENRWNDAQYVGGVTKSRRSGDFMGSGSAGKVDGGITRVNQQFGFTDCGHDNWRAGVVLDPFDP